MDFSRIKAFAFDIDGVATDGGVFCDSNGDLLRTYDAKDGFAIRMAVMRGYPVAVITGGSSESIRKRMITSPKTYFSTAATSGKISPFSASATTLIPPR